MSKNSGTTSETEQLPLKRIHAYWRNPDDTNRHETYLAKGIGRSIFLLDKMRKHAKPNDRILEIGCNAGRNLAFLHHGGFTHLNGTDINRDAIENLRATFPELRRVKLKVSPIEALIKEYPDDAYDVVFTVAVLEHIHWDSDWIFAEMARIAKTIITIEDEDMVTSRHFPRNYQHVFESVGMRQVDYEERVPDLPKPFRFRAFSRT